MSDPIGSKPSLDQTVWQAWKARGRAPDQQGREARRKALKWGLILAWLAVAAIWSQLPSYDILIRCVLAAGAFGVMFDAFNRQQYALAAVFSGLLLLYNPVAPVFDFAGNWQRALLVLSAIPLAASLARHDWKEARVG